MKSARRCRSTPSSSGDATRSRPAAGSWRETRTASRSARRKSWTSWSNIRSGSSVPPRKPAPEQGHSWAPGVACATKDYGTGGDSSHLDGGDRPGWPDCHPLRCAARWATASATAIANRVAAHLGGVADEVAVVQVDTFAPLALVTSGNSLHDGPGDTGRRAAQSTLGAGDQFGHGCLDRRPCRDACGGRGRARRIPVRIVAGGAGTVGHRANRSEGQGMAGGALERRAAGHAGAGAARVAGGGGEGACARRRHRGDGARL